MKHKHILQRFREAFYDLYREHIAIHNSSEGKKSIENQVLDSSSGPSGYVEASFSSWSIFFDYLRMVKTILPHKSDLDIYLEEGWYTCDSNSDKFVAF